MYVLDLHRCTILNSFMVIAQNIILVHNEKKKHSNLNLFRIKSEKFREKSILIVEI